MQSMGEMREMDHQVVAAFDDHIFAFSLSPQATLAELAGYFATLNCEHMPTRITVKLATPSVVQQFA